MSRTDERLSITLPSELKDELKLLAVRNKRSLIAEATIAIQNHLLKSKESEKRLPKNPTVTDVQDWMEAQYAELKERINRELDAALPKEKNTILQNGNGNNAVIGK